MSVGFPSLNPTIRPASVQFAGSQPSSPRGAALGADVFERRQARPSDSDPVSAQHELNQQISDLKEFERSIARAKVALKRSTPVQPTDLTCLAPEQMDEFSALMAEMDHLLPQMDDMLTGLQQGKAVRPLVASANCSAQAPHEFQRKIAAQKEKFAQETAQLKAKQQKEREQAVQKYSIQDTPELRAALLKYGAVVNSTELEAFMAKFGLGSKSA